MVSTIGGLGPAAAGRVSIAQGIAEGDQIHALPPAPWASKGAYSFVPDFQAKAIIPSFNSATVDTWGGAPTAARAAPLVQISWASGGTAGPLADGSYIATPWIWYLSNAAGTKPAAMMLNTTRGRGGGCIAIAQCRLNKNVRYCMYPIVRVFSGMQLVLLMLSPVFDIVGQRALGCAATAPLLPTCPPTTPRQLAAGAGRCAA